MMRERGVDDGRIMARPRPFAAFGLRTDRVVLQKAPGSSCVQHLVARGRIRHCPVELAAKSIQEMIASNFREDLGGLRAEKGDSSQIQNGGKHQQGGISRS